MIEWLTVNAVPLGAAGAIATIAGAAWSFLKRGKQPEGRKTIYAKNQSVAAESIENTTIDMSGDRTEKKDG